MTETTDNRSEPEGTQLATMAQGLFLANLLLLPGVCFAWLAYLYFKHRHTAPALARCHLEQTFIASIIGGALLVIANLAILWLGGYQSAHTWMVLILYFTTVHSTLVLLGIVGLAKAMAGTEFRFPLIGRLSFN
ncbi:MAG: hypothetical protein OQK42_01790 [Sedimenticola sp.]|mgnify:CR=1 FL=1|uniref:Cytochrome C oxidase subunit III n=1 Tax=Sedimenticola thiotaurini TaxID=1543721 RepID=A0A558CFW2_9GAMM|nr:hypothetical protein [Sedimenticola sp.]TVT47656.1 MAG: hypothetical protein FHK82_18045 [Sedimenticola thiotaurini]MCW8920592.1 hypothetical protein [Sedimenticola sp.]MCW8948039.1 hypothetical protein [Sedimenticola sp.]MCW8949146.1 hypothetical protein [Sedimenticola sp.]